MSDFIPFFTPGSVVKTRSGSEYLVTSMRGRVNFKGSKRNADGTFDPGNWVVPLAGVVSVRELTDEEKAARDAGPKLELGSVVTFKSAPKGEKPGQKFVVFKDSGDSVSVTRLGGGGNGRFFKGVTAAHVNIVPVD